MAEEKIYVGKGKKSDRFEQININICLDDIPNEHIYVSQGGKRFIRLKVGEMRNPDDKGNTHTVTVDTWKPSR